MTKTEFVQLLCLRTGLSRNESEKILNAVLDSIEDALAIDGKIMFKNLGSFVVVRRKSRSARNPRTGEMLSIPETSALVFHQATSLKDELNRN